MVHKSDSDELAALRAENVRLVSLLEAHGIEWRRKPQSPVPRVSVLSTNEKVALFRRLFRGRDDVWALRWESKTSGKSGYSPACANEWQLGICGKPRIKCGDCAHRQLIPVSDLVIYHHLAGTHTAGMYPLLEDDSCYFLAVDFDEAEWQKDASAFMRSCDELGVPAALEISRSRQGAHVWIFFASRVSAREARRLGTAIISYTCSRTRQLRLGSYDRLFPNQDTMPKGGFGNLIALPLQKRPRELGGSVFVDMNLQPYPDQWAFLVSVIPMNVQDIEPTILRATGSIHPLDVNFINEEDLGTPWEEKKSSGNRLNIAVTEPLIITLANQIYFEKAQLPQALVNRLIRLAAFPNPEFYKAQAMRMSVWNKPRVIGCAENYPQHIALPRGCLDSALSFLRYNNIAAELIDKRFAGTECNAVFTGNLRAEQEEAVSALLRYDTGVLCAPTAFGKTVTAAAVIARRKVNTLILVHRTELLKQWQERLAVFLQVGDSIGIIGGGKHKPCGNIDIAVVQSISRHGEVEPLVRNYGQIIVDECHHIGAVSFSAILKETNARYLLGLTATSIRRDGLHPIIFMYCGAIRHTAARPKESLHNLEVLTRSRFTSGHLPSDARIQDIFREIALDHDRTVAIAEEAMKAFGQGRKVLVLTERTDHLDDIASVMNTLKLSPFVLHSRLSKKKRTMLISGLNALPPDSPRILLSTGRLIGEGFDHPPLDTLILAMPVSWKGTLQQYAGRLHREHTGKSDVRIIDFVDTAYPVLLRMWDKRQRGYKAMGYRIVADGEGLSF
ncbi:TPA: DEAD/DEAH box helicase family protein [Escherichia coli]|jgi:superfamily II DNA or RNA helicase|uniref:TOTE conflict system archaeo-eukaryotic primase domain-containing protein n=1 Tax=Escherichia coli TaxID=562 RepID=UPI0004D47CBA|nr:DEAD/DEAH box helicase family protein [Escherichia coli]EIT3896749.1 DEAD/DEAH box helicase family protein [Escherichia coli]KDW04819.1 DEAD/DEAH box helicase family protein [Escherichia coli 2-156-04_S3_C1]MDA6993468.1 DEAD/DEAH box helicase family protein [Escherichia coli]HAL9135749.1 DEAD/DEAH box helicase family protein [Escherichia coli]HAL9282492.1 DEAD/DEAH box helicase family protein [Escherichia coli]